MYSMSTSTHCKHLILKIQKPFYHPETMVYVQWTLFKSGHLVYPRSTPEGHLDNQGTYYGPNGCLE